MISNAVPENRGNLMYFLLRTMSQSGLQEHIRVKKLIYWWFLWSFKEIFDTHCQIYCWHNQTKAVNMGLQVVWEMQVTDIG